MKTYIFPSAMYIASFVVAAGLRILLQPYIPEPVISIIFWGIILILFTTYIFRFTNSRLNLLQRPRINASTAGILLAVPVLFVINNFFMVRYAYDYEYVAAIKNSLSLTVLKFTVTSISEEAVYRGFLQSYIDQKLRSSAHIITPGNIFASVIMLLTHLGFFTIMPPLFAVSSLLLVTVFSFAAGYLLSKTHNILLPVLLHIACNYIHILIQCTHSS